MYEILDQRIENLETASHYLGWLDGYLKALGAEREMNEELLKEMREEKLSETIRLKNRILEEIEHLRKLAG